MIFLQYEIISPQMACIAFNIYTRGKNQLIHTKINYGAKFGLTINILSSTGGEYSLMNNVSITGRLTSDPQLKYLPNGGTAVANFILAVDHDYKAKDAERGADFIPCFCWKLTAENAANYLIKGQEAEVVGKLRTRAYTDKEGHKRFVMEVEATEIKYGRKPKSAAADSSEGADGSGIQSFGHEVNLDDDIPF